ncbi:MAG TPA: tripartite tricarboxylate transporter TctB family protein [Chondromyces sp.]|nr:tripartite tricarboxylate transporter TctB family protein [Chondromyces sp.]
MVLKNKDIMSGLLLLIVSIVMYTATNTFKTLTTTNVGPDFMPKIIAAFIAIFSIVIVVSAYRSLKNQKGQMDTEAEGAGETSYAPVFITLAFMIGYLMLMPYIGFLIMTAIYLFLQIYLLAEEGKKKVILFAFISVVSSAIIYYVFRSIFHVMLPIGIFG